MRTVRCVYCVLYKESEGVMYPSHKLSSLLTKYVLNVGTLAHRLCTVDKMLLLYYLYTLKNYYGNSKNKMTSYVFKQKISQIGHDVFEF